MAQSDLKVLIISESGNSPELTNTLEKIVATFPRLIAIVGKDCDSLESICDEFCERSERGLGVTTTSHPGESLSEVQEFVSMFDHLEIGREYRTVKI